MANREAGHKSSTSAAEGRGDEGRARAAGAVKPGVIAKAVEQARSAVQSIQLPRLDWRAFAWGLLVLIVLAFVIRNWAPMRISFFGWYFDAPRAVVLVLMFVFGMMTAWLLEIRSRRKTTDEDEAAEEAAEQGAEEVAEEEVEQAESVEAEVEEIEATADEEDLFPDEDYEADDVTFDEPQDETPLDDEDPGDDEQ